MPTQAQLLTGIQAESPNGCWNGTGVYDLQPGRGSNRSHGRIRKAKPADLTYDRSWDEDSLARGLQ